MKIFDTHAHYTDKRFTDEIDGGVDALLAEVFSSGVEKIINVATTTKNSAEVIAQAARYGGMYAAIGIHPSDIDKEISLDDAIGKLSEMLEGVGIVPSRRGETLSCAEFGVISDMFSEFYKQ